MVPPANPYGKRYAKPRSLAAVAAAVSVVNQPQQQQQQQQNCMMGRQSQQRVNNQKKAFRLASAGKKRKGGQITLTGESTFEAERDCIVCHARSIKDNMLPTYRVPNRAHHVLCVRNKKTHGKGQITKQNVANSAEEKHLKTLYTDPLAEAEKCSGRFTTAQSVNTFFAAKPTTIKKATPTATMSRVTEMEELDLGKNVSRALEDPAFREQHKNNSAPLAMIAFAEEVMDKIVRTKMIGNHFTGLTMMVPHSNAAFNNPQCHSIVGQKLLLVDWIKTCVVEEVPCPDAYCCGTLRNVRSNFSKNKTLFPIFSLDGAPAWCIVQKMACGKCKRDFMANDATVLLTLPPHAAQLYPVETKYALSIGKKRDKRSRFNYANVCEW